MNRNKLSITFYISVLLVFLVNYSFANEKNCIAVLNFYANNVPQSYSRTITNSLEFFLHKNHNNDKNIYLLERMDVKMIFDELKIKESCEEISCVVKVGKTLSADFAITGTIEKIDNYKINVKIVSVTNRQILFVYSESFNSENDIDSVVEKISTFISRDIRYYLKTGKTNTNPNFKFFFSTGFSYAYPVGNFNDIINPGIGFDLMAGVENFIFNNFILGINSGYYRFTGKENDSDEIRFIPVLLNIGYRFNVSNVFYWSPSISGGMNFITTSHKEGAGFDMADNSTRTNIAQMVEANVLFGFIPIDPIHIQFNIGYNFVFEKDDTMDFINFNLGVMFLF